MTALAFANETPRPIPDLSAPSVRSELAPAAVDGFIRLVGIWRLTAKQATYLLGEGSERTWFRMKAGESGSTLSQDALTRISALVGVYKGLHLLFSDPLADNWVSRANSDAPFDGQSPIEHMIKGGIPAMLESLAVILMLLGAVFDGYASVFASKPAYHQVHSERQPQASGASAASCVVWSALGAECA